jgi:hypothetical protein
MGGTYLITPPRQLTKIPMNIKIGELPDHVIFRFNIPKKMVMVRQGMVLPHCVETGVHEFSIKEGFLDLYNVHGRYDIRNSQGLYRVFCTQDSPSLLQQEAYPANEHIYQLAAHGDMSATGPSATGMSTTAAGLSEAGLSAPGLSVPGLSTVETSSTAAGLSDMDLSALREAQQVK